MAFKYLPFTLLVCFSTNLLEINGQRSPYAGSRPSGYKDRLKPELAGGNGDVANRFSENTNERLPYDALGDAALVHQLNQLPEDKRPFWLINRAQIEAHRNTPSAGGVLNSQRPQTAANATANAGNNNNNNNNNNLESRFTDQARPGGSGSAGFRPTGTQSVGGRPISDNIYDHNVISQSPVVYPVNIGDEERQRMENIVQEQQREALALRGNQNPNQNQQLPQAVRSFPVPLTQRDREQPIRARNAPLFRPSPFRPIPRNDFPYPESFYDVAPYFAEYN